MTTVTLSRLQRDGLRWFLSSNAADACCDIGGGDVPEDRDHVLSNLERLRAMLGVFDKIGWEMEGTADEYVIEFDDRECGVISEVESSVRGVIRDTEMGWNNDDRAAQDLAVLDAVLSITAVA